LSSKGEITYNPTDGSYLLTNFYRNPSYPNAGSCHELSSALYDEINKHRETTYKHIKTLFRCVGWDGGRNGVNGYFTGDGADHVFLVAFPEKYDLDYDHQVEDSSHSIYSSEGILIDPSFGGLVRSLEGSDYVVKTILGKNTIISKIKNKILKQGVNFPITMYKGSPWFISNHRELGVTLSNQVFNQSTGFYEFRYYDLENEELEVFFKSDQTFMHLIKTLKAKIKNQKVTDKPF
jgi:hypothetical protein